LEKCHYAWTILWKSYLFANFRRHQTSNSIHSHWKTIRIWNLQSSTTHYFGGNPRLGRPDIKFILGLTSIQVNNNEHQFLISGQRKLLTRPILTDPTKRKEGKSIIHSHDDKPCDLDSSWPPPQNNWWASKLALPLMTDFS